MSDPVNPPSNAQYWERIERARKMTGEERMVEGVRMFDRECEAMRFEVMEANPAFTEADAQAEVRRRVREEWEKEDAELRKFMTTFIPK